MPQYVYRDLHPTSTAERKFLAWIDELDREFSNPDPDHRSDVVRNALHEIYLGRPYQEPDTNSCPLAELALIHSFDPRNATLEPEYYGDVDAVKYAQRKPLIWFWMMFDRSPLGINHWLGFRMRSMIARHVLKHLGQNVKIFHGVEVSFGYNLTIEDNCVIHKYVLLDDRGEIVIREGTSVSDYANVYSHSHAMIDSSDVTNSKTEIGPKARITYHATVLSGVKVGYHAIVGSMALASRDVEACHIVGGIPAKTLKVKPISPALEVAKEER